MCVPSSTRPVGWCAAISQKAKGMWPTQASGSTSRSGRSRRVCSSVSAKLRDAAAWSPGIGLVVLQSPARPHPRTLDRVTPRGAGLRPVELITPSSAGPLVSRQDSDCFMARSSPLSRLFSASIASRRSALAAAQLRILHGRARLHPGEERRELALPRAAGVERVGIGLLQAASACRRCGGGCARSACRRNRWRRPRADVPSDQLSATAIARSYQPISACSVSFPAPLRLAMIPWAPLSKPVKW